MAPLAWARSTATTREGCTAPVFACSPWDCDRDDSSQALPTEPDSGMKQTTDRTGTLNATSSMLQASSIRVLVFNGERSRTRPP